MQGLWPSFCQGRAKDLGNVVAGNIKPSFLETRGEIEAGLALEGIEVRSTRLLLAKN